ncbi:hypothetical protein T07_7583 [Trichinella nelsoni]|uniref:Uncharacterized protein n=1 Tax=Trichinella nelsoni TaxID=6336 RepID=A0A0V0SI08_9BILA|nr:hypothetical protein T07_7583 [Trichinella nelsoni]
MLPKNVWPDGALHSVQLLSINLHPVKLELKSIQSISRMQFLKIPSWQNSVGCNSRLKQLISYWALLAQLKQCEQASAAANREGIPKVDSEW